MRIAILSAGIIVLAVIAYLFYPDSHDIRNSVPLGESIVCFGDSLTYGTGAGKGMDYPSQLSRLIGQEVINAGVPGETTAGALRRIQTIIDLEPAIVMITLGGNDLKNGIKKEAAFYNLETIITTLQERGTLVIIGGIDVPFWGRGFGKAYEELAQKTGSVLIDNVFKGILGRPHLMSDTIHPNSQGYGVMAGHFYKAVAPYL